MSSVPAGIMPRKKSKKRVVLWSILAVFLVAFGYGFMTMRRIAGGVHNLVSRAWWMTPQRTKRETALSPPYSAC